MEKMKLSLAIRKHLMPAPETLADVAAQMRLLSEADKAWYAEAFKSSGLCEIEGYAAV